MQHSNLQRYSLQAGWKEANLSFMLHNLDIKRVYAFIQYLQCGTFRRFARDMIGITWVFSTTQGFEMSCLNDAEGGRIVCGRRQQPSEPSSEERIKKWGVCGGISPLSLRAKLDYDPLQKFLPEIKGKIINTLVKLENRGFSDIKGVSYRPLKVY